MTDLGEYERRIAAALQRIGAGLSQRAAGPGDAMLAQALEDERTANAQLQERLRQLRDRGDARVAAALAERDAARAEVAAMDATLQSLRASQSDLSETVAALRAALAEGVAEPDLVNRAMQAEIDGLRALRAADAAEVDQVLNELRPLVAEGP